MPKRRADEADLETTLLATGIDDDDWFQKLLALDTEQVIHIVSEIVNRCSIDDKSVKKARIELPSFSTAKWVDFAVRTGLPRDPSYLEFKTFVTPIYQLPPSFHKAVFENSWRTQDAYQEIVMSKGESVMKMLDPYLVPILALFQGRVVDKPEGGTRSNAFATGCEVDHEIVMVGGILFIVVEARFQINNNNLAQLFLELLSAADINKNTDFEGLCVYGILTNFLQFSFYSYNPISCAFGRDEDIFVETRRDGFSTWMIYVSNKIFGLVLSAFIKGLSTMVVKGRQKLVKGDALSIKGWENALQAAEDCCQKFKENITSIQEMEIRSTKALDLLTASVCSIPRISAYTTAQNNCLTSVELKDHACIIVENALQVYLS